MATLNVSATRQMLEESWRLRVEETRARYNKATEHYRHLLQQQPERAQREANGSLALARKAESEALAEYSRVLRTFTELTVNGKIPEQQPAAGSSGV